MLGLELPLLYVLFLPWCHQILAIIIIIVVIIQLAQMLGEGDELVPEHLMFQDKLQELQYKKQHMDHLVAEFQSLHNHPSLMTGK